jgi:hypothetical protein
MRIGFPADVPRPRVMEDAQMAEPAAQRAHACSAAGVAHAL